MIGKRGRRLRRQVSEPSSPQDRTDKATEEQQDNDKAETVYLSEPVPQPPTNRPPRPSKGDETDAD